MLAQMKFDMLRLVQSHKQCRIYENLKSEAITTFFSIELNYMIYEL